MPFKWVKPKVFMQYRGIKIYHTYRHDTITDPNQYCFTFDENEPDFDQYIFDVRELVEQRGVEGYRNALTPEDMKKIIKIGMIEGCLLNYMLPDIAEKYYEKYGPLVFILEEGRFRFDSGGRTQS